MSCTLVDSWGADPPPPPPPGAPMDKITAKVPYRMEITSAQLDAFHIFTPALQIACRLTCMAQISNFIN